MELYRLLWGTHTVPLDTPIYPSIPKNVMEGEDQTLRRICTSTSLDGCLTGIGPSHIGLNNLKDQLAKERRIGWEDIDGLFPFTLLVFLVDWRDSDIMLTGKVANYVPDAFETDEYWITKPAFPSEVRLLWLIGGCVEKSDLLVNGSKHEYLRISDSVWSTTPAKAVPAFSKQIMLAARRWLEQN